MQDVILVQILQSESHLHQPVPNLLFREMHLFDLPMPANALLEVTGVGVFHDDVEDALTQGVVAEKAVFVADDVDVAAFADDLDLV